MSLSRYRKRRKLNVDETYSVGSRNRHKRNDAFHSYISADDDIHIGDRVKTGCGKFGIIKFIGNIKKYPMTIYGLELDAAIYPGNNGTIGGKRYFTTSKGCGFFTFNDNLTKIGDRNRGSHSTYSETAEQKRKRKQSKGARHSNTSTITIPENDSKLKNEERPTLCNSNDDRDAKLETVKVDQAMKRHDSVLQSTKGMSSNHRKQSSNHHDSKKQSPTTNVKSTKIKLEPDDTENASLRQRIKDLEYCLDAQKRESDKRISDLLLRMKAFKEMAIKGSDPDYSSVPMHIHNETKNRKYSEKCYRHREKVMQYNNDQVVLQVVKKQHSRKSTGFKTAIKDFLSANGDGVAVLDQSLANLVISGLQYEVDEVLEEFVIPKPHRISALIGQKGLRAKMDIPLNTCLGQYVGVNYLKQEYLQIFENSSEGYLRNMYAFDLKVDVDGKEVELIVDGYALIQMIGESGHLMRINDCRLDIHMEQPSNDDRKFENVELVECKVNGWPVIFVITTKAVKAGDELFAFFGAHFGVAMKGWDDNDKWRHRIRMRLDAQVMVEERDALVHDRHDVYDSD